MQRLSPLRMRLLDVCGSLFGKIHRAEILQARRHVQKGDGHAGIAAGHEGEVIHGAQGAFRAVHRHEDIITGRLFVHQPDRQYGGMVNDTVS
jgi:hypothetical protein